MGQFHPTVIFLNLAEDLKQSLAQIHRLRKATQAKIVVVGPMNDPYRILGIVHAGADDYLDEAGDLASQIQDALQRQNQKSQLNPANGRIVVVTSACGGSGASVVSANISACVAQRIGTCHLLDYDLRHPDQASLFNLVPRHTLADLCQHIEALDREMLDRSLTSHSSGVKLVAAPQAIAEAERISVAGLVKILNRTRTSAPFAVVDYPEIRDESRLGILRSAEAVLVVFRLDFTSLRNVRRWLDELERLAIDQ